MLATSKCWSVTSKPHAWNLFPMCNKSSWRVVDLKASGRTRVVQTPGGELTVYQGLDRYQVLGNGGNQVYKFLWEGREAGSTAHFKVDCSAPSSDTRLALRVMTMVSNKLKYGKASVSIDGVLLGVMDGYRPKAGSVYSPRDFHVPPSTRRKRIVSVTVLPSDGTVPSGAGVGFGLNALICLPLA
eukprot:4553890-Prymnesium_polylepis.1